MPNAENQAKLMEIASEEQWNSLLTKINEKTRMASSLTDADGAIILTTGERNPLCARIRETTDTLQAVCSKTNIFMTNEVKRLADASVEVCEMGMWRIALPVKEGGEIIGQLTVCGRADTEDEIDQFVLTKLLGVSEEDAKRLAESPESADEETMQAYLLFMKEALQSVQA